MSMTSVVRKMKVGKLTATAIPPFTSKCKGCSGTGGATDLDHGLEVGTRKQE